LSFLEVNCYSNNSKDNCWSKTFTIILSFIWRISTLQRWEGINWYQFVDLTLGQIVVYNSNSNLYLASCLTIKELIIPEKVDKWTEDIPVIVQNESENKIVYLTKQGILRNQI
jgi:hypothetical protein